MSVKIYPSEPCLLPITFSDNPLEIYNKDYADIEEVLICFKNKVTEPENTYLVKYLKDGTGTGADSGEVLIDESTNTFTLVKTENDVVQVNPKGYRVFIGVKVTGLNKYLWLRVKENNVVIVEQDGISI
jgi:hypothetical protein